MKVILIQLFFLLFFSHRSTYDQFGRAGTINHCPTFLGCLVRVLCRRHATSRLQVDVYSKKIYLSNFNWGNDHFHYRWARIFTDGRLPLECGTGQRLIVTNVTYEQQGQYICLASNKINGHRREVKSDPVSLQVVGAPRVMYTSLITILFTVASINTLFYKCLNKTGSQGVEALIRFTRCKHEFQRPLWLR